MSYRSMSNREGNQQRVMEMHEAKMSPGVIAAYMTDWKVPMGPQDVQGIINTYEPMGDHAVKKTDVLQAIETHRRYIEPLNHQQAIVEDDDQLEVVYDEGDDDAADQ